MDIDLYRFNNDLLVDEQDRETAITAFPDVAHIIDYPELRKLFLEFDVPAGAAKKRSRLAGALAVCLAGISLLGISAAPFYSGARWENIAVLFFAMCGVSAVVIGLGGVLLRRQKLAWLYRRLVTERLRQFHFQAFIARYTDIVHSLQDDASRSQFLAKRSEWLAEFKLRFYQTPGSELRRVLQGEEKFGVWLYPFSGQIDRTVAAQLPENLFRSYRQLRIRHQIHYAEWKLREEHNILIRGGLHQLEFWMSSISLAAILAIFALHLGLAAFTLLNVHVLSFEWVHLVVIWCAILILAIRVGEEGLQPGRELERYRHYRFAVEDVLARFDATQSANSKLRIMIEMERLAYGEMCEFLRENYSARFVM